jgi:outer membrane protein TolC
MVREHRADIAAMVAEWKSDLSRLQRYEGEIVPLARRRSDAALAAYRGLKGSLGDVLGARRAEIEARVPRLQREAQAARLWA